MTQIVRRLKCIAKRLRIEEYHVGNLTSGQLELIKALLEEENERAN